MSWWVVGGGVRLMMIIIGHHPSIEVIPEGRSISYLVVRRALSLSVSLSVGPRAWRKFLAGILEERSVPLRKGDGGQNFFSNTNAQRKIQHRAVLLNHDSGVAISGHPVSKIFCLIYKTSLGTFGRADPETPAGFGLSSFVLFCAVRVVITLSVCPVCSIGSIIALATAGQNSGRSGRE